MLKYTSPSSGTTYMYRKMLKCTSPSSSTNYIQVHKDFKIYISFIRYNLHTSTQISFNVHLLHQVQSTYKYIKMLKCTSLSSSTTYMYRKMLKCTSPSSSTNYTYKYIKILKYTSPSSGTTYIQV